LRKGKRKRGGRKIPTKVAATKPRGDKIMLGGGNHCVRNRTKKMEKKHSECTAKCEMVVFTPLKRKGSPQTSSKAQKK